MKIKVWIEAMRLRTIPVSISGVVIAIGYCLMYGCFKLLPSLLCLLFAILAQISSNFANEYYDFKAGLDKPGRDGPRRGVTEGDIKPVAMLTATFLTLALACIIGLSLIYWGGWWLILAGIIIAIGVLAYSTGPYPLSRHALGEVAVIFFFGIIPVNLTFYIENSAFNTTVLCGSLAAGLMGANILLVNNYRDAADDKEVGKNTVAVKFGKKFAITWYLFNGYLAVALMAYEWLYILPKACIAIPVIYLLLHTFLWYKIQKLNGPSLNPMLGITAMLMLLYSLGFALSNI